MLEKNLIAHALLAYAPFELCSSWCLLKTLVSSLESLVLVPTAVLSEAHPCTSQASTLLALIKCPTGILTLGMLAVQALAGNAVRR